MTRTLLACLFTTTLLIGCSGSSGVDEVVGAACVDDRDCADRCYRGGSFPGGFCSRECRDDLDCPEDTICTNKDGGVCLFPCGDSRDCDLLGPRYVCKGEDDWAGRPVGVCLGD